MNAGTADRRSLARAFSRVANASVAEVLAMTRGPGGNCRRIGVTGSPGVGKSSVIARLAKSRLQHPGELAIIAIDPTSPNSGGAILGDRIRMQDLADEPRVFIRSLASRVSQDGLTDNLPDILAVAEHAGFAEVIVETVGVGQVGYAIRRVVDTNVLVLMPGEGDQIQAMKSGILETADICVVNKADLPGARQLAADLRSVVRPPGVMVREGAPSTDLHHATGQVVDGGPAPAMTRPVQPLHQTGAHNPRQALNPRGESRWDWVPPVVQISAGAQEGIDALSEAIDRHQAWLDQRDLRDATMIERRAQHIGSLVARRTAEILQALPNDVLSLPLAAAYAAVVAEMQRSCTAGPPDGGGAGLVRET